VASHRYDERVPDMTTNNAPSVPLSMVDRVTYIIVGAIIVGFVIAFLV
jgi:hypothetical protein